MLKNSPENTCIEVSFSIKLHVWGCFCMVSINHLWYIWKPTYVSERKELKLTTVLITGNLFSTVSWKIVPLLLKFFFVICFRFYIFIENYAEDGTPYTMSKSTSKVLRKIRPASVSFLHVFKITLRTTYLTCDTYCQWMGSCRWQNPKLYLWENIRYKSWH